ncbi:MAG: putative ABC transporter permease [Bacillota bacterium]|jgi:hypothetical protein
MRKIGTALILAAFGGGCYCAIETVWRGKSHWTMFIVGGVCFLLLCAVDGAFREKLPRPGRWLLGAAAVTAVEFVSGCLLNLCARWHVWDYSGRRLNLLGQICPRSAVYWLLLAIPAMLLGEHLLKAVNHLFRRRQPR